METQYSILNTQYSVEAKASSENYLQQGLSLRLLTAVQPSSRPAAAQHIGMFAGSLLSYDS